MDVTIVIPSFNRPEKTARAVASVLRQPAECDITVVDDGSNPPLSLPKDERVRIVRRASNGGAGAARNTGLDHVTTPIVGFLDSDDEMLPDTLGRRIEHARAHGIGDASRRMLFACGWQYASDGGRHQATRLPVAADTPAAFFSGCWFSPGSAILANTALFAPPDGRFDDTLRRLEDFELFARLSLAGLALVSQPIIGVTVDDGSTRNAHDVADAIAQLRARFAEQAATGVIDNRLLARALSYLDYEEARLNLSTGKRLEAAASLLRSWLRQPRTKLYPGPGWSAA